MGYYLSPIGPNQLDNLCVFLINLLQRIEILSSPIGPTQLDRSSENTIYHMVPKRNYQSCLLVLKTTLGETWKNKHEEEPMKYYNIELGNTKHGDTIVIVI